MGGSTHFLRENPWGRGWFQNNEAAAMLVSQINPVGSWTTSTSMPPATRRSPHSM